jgi:3-phenylpropionate/cinnamic acid dioxygenase small subunit
MENQLAVTRTLSEYCRTCDDGQFEKFAQLFEDDAVLFLGKRIIRGRDAIRDTIASNQPPERRGGHVTSNTVITIEGSEAHAESDFVFFQLGEGGIPIPASMGRYIDELKLVDGGWRFSQRQIQFRRFSKAE